MAMGKKTGHGRAAVFRAYTLAKLAERQAESDAVRAQNELLKSEGIKVLVVGHAYNVYDKYVGAPVIKTLRELGAIPILAEVADKRKAREKSFEITDTLPWVYNRELVGAVQEYAASVDGIILMSAFPCGPDSLVNEILIRRVHGKPMLNLVLDNQEGDAGIETRLESFVDIIRFKREVQANEA
jgi:predicted nucleotide-binding protein (sugar kinase/HSP70/actin superfamily)